MNETILIVDDSDAARRNMREILERSSLGLRVLEAADGSEALPLALDGVADVVLSDIIMPKLDGVQLLRAIRQKRDVHSLPVILVTSHTDHETRTISFESGVNDYLYKPFSAPELIGRLQVQLRLRALAEDLRHAKDQHRRLGTHDELTGLANRRHLLTLARRELARSRRHQFSMALAIFDIDALREVNRHGGYLVGDAVVAEVGGLLERTLRVADVLAHFSGGRFGALLPQTNDEQCVMVCDRLIAATAAHVFPGQKTGSISISGGLATYPSGRLESIDELIGAALDALAQAKAHGGGRFAMWTPSDRVVSKG